jgi:hypothetical protein
MLELYILATMNGRINHVHWLSKVRGNNDYCFLVTTKFVWLTPFSKTNTHPHNHKFAYDWNHVFILEKCHQILKYIPSTVYIHVSIRLYLVTQPVWNVSFSLDLKAVEDKGIMFLQNIRKSLSSDTVSYPRRIQSSLLLDNCMVFILTQSSQIYRQYTLLLYIYPKRYELCRCKWTKHL